VPISGSLAAAQGLRAQNAYPDIARILEVSETLESDGLPARRRTDRRLRAPISCARARRYVRGELLWVAEQGELPCVP
jgi:hypothetical protein